MTPWNDTQYLKFGDERTRAARELLSRVPLERAERVVDLGCGPGNSTALLRERWPNARLRGVDNSPEMLERARLDFPTVEWTLGDAGSYRATEPVDLLFANAVLHWLPEHATLFPSLIEQLRKGGVLAVQMPLSTAPRKWVTSLLASEKLDGDSRCDGLEAWPKSRRRFTSS